MVCHIKHRMEHCWVALLGVVVGSLSLSFSCVSLTLRTVGINRASPWGIRKMIVLLLFHCVFPEPSSSSSWAKGLAHIEQELETVATKAATSSETNKQTNKKKRTNWKQTHTFTSWWFTFRDWPLLVRVRRRCVWRFVATIMYERFFFGVRVCISSFGMFIFCCAQCFSTMFNSIDLRVSSFYGDGIWLCFSFFLLSCR